MSIIVQFDSFIDDTINGGALAVFEALAVPSAEFLVLLAGGALTWWAALSALRGVFSFEGFLSFAWRFLLFYSLVSGSFLWVDIVYPSLRDFGPSVGNVVLETFSGEENPGGIITGLTLFISEAFEGIDNGLDGLSFGSVITGKGLMAVFVSFITMIVVVAMAIIALALISFSKVIMAILIGITPVLAVWAFVKNTADVFNGWMRGVSMLIVFQILLYGVLGTVLAASQSLTFDASVGLSIADQINKNLAVFLVVSGVGLASLFLTPMIAYTVGGAVMKLGSNGVFSVIKNSSSASQESNPLRPDSGGNASEARSQAANEAASKPDKNGLTPEDNKHLQATIERNRKYDRENP
ncbi:type IV secretion system protein [Pelagibius sp. Alg239-R121]|uniref:type IV secretion system protein n=1 Tax=Pelagibius sp. Alg239-R121 TaxID=2993448 RepID=UPI0024A61096|nr:type IV secretion system protein [Pelagibius sp. Alg239-R121]